MAIILLYNLLKLRRTKLSHDVIPSVYQLRYILGSWGGYNYVSEIYYILWLIFTLRIKSGRWPFSGNLPPFLTTASGSGKQRTQKLWVLFGMMRFCRRDSRTFYTLLYRGVIIETFQSAKGHIGYITGVGTALIFLQQQLILSPSF